MIDNPLSIALASKQELLCFGGMMSDHNRSRHLKDQIDKIRDTRDRAEGDFYEVIVRVRSSDKKDAELLKSLSHVFSERRLSISARECLPPSRDALEAASASGSTPDRLAVRERRDLSAARHSVLAELAKKQPAQAETVEDRRTRGNAALAPLLQSDAVRETSDKTARAKNKQAKAVGLWTSNSAVIQVYDDSDLDDIAARGDIEDIFINRRLSVPPVSKPTQASWPNTVHDNKTSSWGIRQIGALAAWGAYGARGKGVVVGLLDTGVDPNHPDLKGKIKHWAEFDRNGKELGRSRARDSGSHGTHCAGTIVGGHASERWIGVAPEAKLAVGLVLDGELGGTDAQVLRGIQWCVDKKVDVINMSLGGFVHGAEVPPTYTEAFMSATRAGIPVVTAIGNEGSQTSGSPGCDYFAFAVGATDTLDRAAGFSGGRTHFVNDSRYFPQESLPLFFSTPDVSAPGVAIYSSVPTTSSGEPHWEHLNGTSMAAPHVAGAIALLLSATNFDDSKRPITGIDRSYLIQDLLTGSAVELGEAGQNHRFGFGRIDVLAAIGYAKEHGY